MNIKIGSSNYKLVVTKELDSEQLEGDLSYGKKQIRINKNYANESKEQAFWHEVIHGIFIEMCEIELCNDEKIVELLAKQIYGVLCNNNLEKIYNYLRR